MYEIHHRRSIGSVKDYALIGRANTLEQARNKRCVSGDLVVYRVGHKVVEDPSWLWDWEMDKGMDSYAFRAIVEGQ